MERWRQLLSWLGQDTDSHQQCTGASNGPSISGPAEVVETSEITLILLKNAIRLLDQSMAPPEVRTQLAIAIQQIEELIAARRD